MTDLFTHLSAEIQALKNQNIWRTLKENRNYTLNFSSSDYLGIAQDFALAEKFYEQYPPHQLSFGASSSRLLTGNHLFYTQYEKQLSDIYSSAALCFNSGFDANVALISTLYRKGDAIFCDRLSHASIYEAIKLSGAQIFRFKHLDESHLQILLEKNRKNFRHALIVSEGLFSMDGDCCNIEALVELKLKYDAQLYIDEAHSFGIYGENGLGLVHAAKKTKEVDFLMLGLGKAAASVGGVLLCKELVKDYLINKAKRLIYSTAQAPLQMAWNIFVLQEMIERKEARAHLHFLISFFAEKLKQKGYLNIHHSPIFGLQLGNNLKVSEKALELQAKACLVYPIKTPTVPAGTERLRISLHAGLRQEDVQVLLGCL